MSTKQRQRQPLKQALAEGQARHNQRLARNAGAVFIPSLDGYVISERDLLKLIENQREVKSP